MSHLGTRQGAPHSRSTNSRDARSSTRARLDPRLGQLPRATSLVAGLQEGPGLVGAIQRRRALGRALLCMASDSALGDRAVHQGGRRFLPGDDRIFPARPEVRLPADCHRATQLPRRPARHQLCRRDLASTDWTNARLVNWPFPPVRQLPMVGQSGGLPCLIGPPPRPITISRQSDRDSKR